MTTRWSAPSPPTSSSSQLPAAFPSASASASADGGGRRCDRKHLIQFARSGLSSPGRGLRPSRNPRSSPSPGCCHRELLRLRLPLRPGGALGDWPMREAAWRRRGGGEREEAEAREHVAEVWNLEDAGISRLVAGPRRTVLELREREREPLL